MNLRTINVKFSNEMFKQIASKKKRFEEKLGHKCTWEDFIYLRTVVEK